MAKVVQWMPILLCLIGLFVFVESAPYEMVWISVKSDPKLKSLLDWSEFAASKGDTMKMIAERVAHQGGLTLDSKVADFTVNEDLHLYRLESLDPSKTIEEQRVETGDLLYLTNEDLLEHQPRFGASV